MIDYPTLNWQLINTWEITDKVFILPETFTDRRLILSSVANTIDDRLSISGDLRAWAEFPSLGDQQVTIGSLLVPITELSLSKSIGFEGNGYRLTFTRASGVLTPVQLKIWRPTNMPLVDFNENPYTDSVTRYVSGDSVSITASVTQIIAANSSRKGLRIKNTGTNPLYIGFTNAVTTATSFQIIPSNTAYEFQQNYQGDIYGFCAANRTTTAVATEAL